MGSDGSFDGSTVFTITCMNVHNRIASREAVISIVGLGYVGLPLAILFADAGFTVHGIDIDKERVRAINAGQSYISDVADSTIERLVLQEGRVTVAEDYEAVALSDAIIVCVPTPLSKTRSPDVSHVADAAERISPHLREGTLVVMESTMYPGCTEEFLLPLLQANCNTRLEPGRDFYLAFSPERVDPGQSAWTISNTSKLIGGLTPACTEAASALYESIVDRVHCVSSPKAAEMAKLLENTFRATNIALANEMALICDRLGLDVWEVIEAAGTKPFGFMAFYPGPGLGGHCIPVDPQYLAWKLRTLDYTARFIQLAEDINFSMPQHVVGKIADALNEESKALRGSSVLILGIAYKPDVNDTRESPALEIVRLLAGKGAIVAYHDPLVPAIHYEGLDLRSVATEGQLTLEDALQKADCTVIVTDHSSYDWQTVAAAGHLFVDTRNALRKAGAVAGRVFTL